MHAFPEIRACVMGPPVVVSDMSSRGSIDGTWPWSNLSRNSSHRRSELVAFMSCLRDQAEKTAFPTSDAPLKPAEAIHARFICGLTLLPPPTTARKTSQIAAMTTRLVIENWQIKRGRPLSKRGRKAAIRLIDSAKTLKAARALMSLKTAHRKFLLAKLAGIRRTSASNKSHVGMSHFLKDFVLSLAYSRVHSCPLRLSSCCCAFLSKR